MEENEKKEVEQEETRETGGAGDASPAQAAPAGAPVLKKADIGKRALAIIIDSVLAGIVVAVLPFLGVLIGMAYMLLRDGFQFDFMDGRSLGKKLVKLELQTIDGAAIDLVTSAKRNWMFALLPIFAIPVLGWLLALVGLVISVIEIYLVITKDDGRRWGDQLAGTQVIESAE